MPQTLLATLALAIAGVFMLGQSETSTHNVQAVVASEFELAATGTLLQALEFADSRAFDEATTPEALRLRLRLPAVMTDAQRDLISGHDLLDLRADELAPRAQFGRTPAGQRVACNVAAPSSTPQCNDLSDLHDSGWQLIRFTASPGVTIPIEVRFEVSYVEAGNMDATVSHRTFHKRVDAWARSPDLARRMPGHEIRLHRVISYDPEVAAEYLRRSYRTQGGSAAACAATRAELEATAAAAATAATAAQAAVATAQQQYDAAQAAATTAQQQLTAAQAAVTAAQQQVTAAQQTLTTRRAELAAAEASYSQMNWLQQLLYYNWIQGIRNQVANAEAALATAQTAHQQAQAALAPKQAAAQQAQATVQARALALQQARLAQQQAAAASQQAAAAVAAFSCP